jgi:hypothetical protein
MLLLYPIHTMPIAILNQEYLLMWLEHVRKNGLLENRLDISVLGSWECGASYVGFTREREYMRSRVWLRGECSGVGSWVVRKVCSLYYLGSGSDDVTYFWNLAQYTPRMRLVKETEGVESRAGNSNSHLLRERNPSRPRRFTRWASSSKIFLFSIFFTVFASVYSSF